MTSKELRAKAWEACRGNWKNLGLAWLIYLGLGIAIAILSSCGIGVVLYYVLFPPFILGFCMCCINVARGKGTKPSGTLDGIGNMRGAVALNFMNSLLVSLWSLLFYIPGIVKAYAYALSFYVLADHPEMTQSEARAESVRLMEGNKMRLFLLHLSFIGWYLLSALTFGILLFWVAPCINVATAFFYDELKESKPRFGFVDESDANEADRLFPDLSAIDENNGKSPRRDSDAPRESKTRFTDDER